MLKLRGINVYDLAKEFLFHDRKERWVVIFFDSCNKFRDVNWIQSNAICEDESQLPCDSDQLNSGVDL